MKNFVVMDASPLIGLAIAEGLSWLPKLFDTVYVSTIVKNEVLPGTGVQGEDETDCINIAMQYADQVLLVMDERAGRSIAKEKGLKVIGTAAIISTAKQQGLISSAKEVFECLHQSSFRISPPVFKQILDRVGE